MLYVGAILESLGSMHYFGTKIMNFGEKLQGENYNSILSSVPVTKESHEMRMRICWSVHAFCWEVKQQVSKSLKKYLLILAILCRF